MSVFCECCVLSGRGLYDGLISRLEESYRMWCVLSVIEEPHRGEISQLRMSSHEREEKGGIICWFECASWRKFAFLPLGDE